MTHDTPPKQVWTKIRQTQERKIMTVIPALITNGNTTNDNQEIAETLAKRFYHKMTNKSHISETNSLDANKTLITDQRDVSAMNLPFTLSELSDYMFTSESSAPDQIIYPLFLSKTYQTRVLLNYWRFSTKFGSRKSFEEYEENLTSFS